MATSPTGMASIAAPEASSAEVPAALGVSPRPFGEAKDWPLAEGSRVAGAAYDAAAKLLWFAAPGLGSVGRLSIATGEVAYFRLGNGARPVGLALAPGGWLFVTDKKLNVLHRLARETGEATRYPMPSDAPFLDLGAAGVDAQDRVWFTSATGRFGSLDPATGDVDLSQNEDFLGASSVASGLDGRLWFAASRSARLIRLNATNGRYDTFLLPNGLSGPRGLAIGADGSAWVAFPKKAALAVWQGPSNWRVVSLPWADSKPTALLARGDGTLFVADSARRKLLRYRAAPDRIDEVGDLGEGGQVRALIETGDGVLVVDGAADRVRFFPDRAPGG